MKIADPLYNSGAPFWWFPSHSSGFVHMTGAYVTPARLETVLEFWDLLHLNGASKDMLKNPRIATYM